MHDYVLGGAGSPGCAIAARLSELEGANQRRMAYAQGRVANSSIMPLLISSNAAAIMIAEKAADPIKGNRRLGDVLAMRTHIAYCLTEAEAGSDLASVKTTATRTASGWALNGAKLWIHNAPLADLGFVLTRTDPGAGHRGLSIFIVDLHAASVTRGPKEHKMGQQASQVGGLMFDNVELDEQALLGPPIVDFTS